MRSYHYKPRAEKDLDALADLDMIDDAVKELAANRKKGYVIPLQSPFLGPGETLLQYRVGRYKLNYTLSKKELSVRSVMV